MRFPKFSSKEDAKKNEQLNKKPSGDLHLPDGLNYLSENLFIFFYLVMHPQILFTVA